MYFVYVIVIALVHYVTLMSFSCVFRVESVLVSFANGLDFVCLNEIYSLYVICNRYKDCQRFFYMCVQ